MRNEMMLVARARIALAMSVVACVAVACGGGDTPESVAARAESGIERATGKTFKSPPKLEERSHDEVRTFLEQSFDAEMPAEKLFGIERAYKRFGLLPDSINLRSTMLDLLNEQVVGYYDPRSKVLYVVKGSRADLLNVTVEHELIHALQDQYFPLDSLTRIRDDNDRQTAAHAVVEGQATWEQLTVMASGANPENVMPGGWDAVRQRIRSERNGMPHLASAPLWLGESLLFPYLSGAEHIRQFKMRRAGGWPFDSLPESTEQILHASKYFDERDHPTTVTLPPLRAGATVLSENNLGEFETRLYFYELSHELTRSANAASGWDGDRYALVSLGGKAEALVWATVWDTPLDAAEFVDALGLGLSVRYPGIRRSPGGGEKRRYEGGGRTVELVAVTVDGRSVVLFTDVPAGVATDLVDPAKIRLSS